MPTEVNCADDSAVRLGDVNLSVTLLRFCRGGIGTEVLSTVGMTVALPSCHVIDQSLAHPTSVFQCSGQNVEMVDHQLLRDVETRWSSTLLMLERGLELRPVSFLLRHYSYTGNGNILFPNFRPLITSLVRVLFLRSFASTTLKMPIGTH